MIEHKMAFYNESVEEAESLRGILQNMPAVVKVLASDNLDDTYTMIHEDDYENVNNTAYGIPDDTEIMLQRTIKAQYARIKFIEDSEYIVPSGAEHVHTCNRTQQEYLLPLACGAQFQYIRRPECSGLFNTIAELLKDPPLFVETLEDCYARIIRDMTTSKNIPAHTVLELKRTFISVQNDKRFLECTSNNIAYAIEINRNIPTKALDDSRKYMLLDLKKMLLFPRFINFQSSISPDVVLRNCKLSNPSYTQLEGPIEVLGIHEVESLIGWVRNAGYRSYETVLIPCNIWQEIKVRPRYFPQIKRERYLQERYKNCWNSNSVQTSMYILPADLQEVTWLRLPDLFIRKGYHTFIVPDDVQLQFEEFEDSSDEYATMTDVLMPTPDTPTEPKEKDKITTTQKTSMLTKLKRRLLLFSHKDTEESKELTNTPKADISRQQSTDMQTLADCFPAQCSNDC